jgi:hypothetical protein
MCSSLEHVCSRRYLSHGSYRKSKGSKEVIAEDLHQNNNGAGERPWLTAEDSYKGQTVKSTLTEAAHSINRSSKTLSHNSIESSSSCRTINRERERERERTSAAIVSHSYTSSIDRCTIIFQPHCHSPIN